MQFSFVIHDPELIDVLRRLGRKRGLFIEYAIRDYLKTEKGKNVLELLLGQNALEVVKEEKKKKGKISIDDFL